ncbi:MAG TPA: paraquat-inducible protein A [Steroidobacteraceae bacterium]|nr:paraquat-inducible protein A [Steroidobacteraceae bacterium]
MTIACSDCGTLQDLPPLAARAVATCPVCRNRMESRAGRSLVLAWACSMATFLLLIPANALPLMRVSILGMTRESRIGSEVLSMWNHQWVVIALLVAALVIVLPLMRFGVLTVVLGLVQTGARSRWLGQAFRWTLQLDQWAMPDVFLLGCAVGYSRIRANLPVTIEGGGICIILAAITCMLTRAALDKRAVWRRIDPESELRQDSSPVTSCVACELVLPLEQQGRRCPRCGLRVHGRKPYALMRTLALVIAGVVLYLPANVFPMSSDIQAGDRATHRIIDGIRELFAAGLWPLGIVIFCTSVAIPLLKLLGLGWLMLSIRRRSHRALVFKTSAYRIIDEVGRWSCIDVFTIAVFVPLLQFDGLVRSEAAPGALAFILVVVLTMWASRTFDPRLLWDAAGSEST